MKSLLRKMSKAESILLLNIWGAVIITGFLALGAVVGEAESLLVFSRMHIVLVRLGAVYTCVYTYQCRAKIIKCLGFVQNSNKKNKHVSADLQPQKSNLIEKIMKSVALHILLHIISIHLAIAYTIFHIKSRKGDAI